MSIAHRIKETRSRIVALHRIIEDFDIAAGLILDIHLPNHKTIRVELSDGELMVLHAIMDGLLRTEQFQVELAKLDLSELQDVLAPE